MNIETVRDWQFQQLDDHLKAVESILGGAAPDALTTFRDGGSGWTALEVLCHLRDYEAIYFERFRLTIEQERPALPNADPDALAAERRYNEQAVDTVLREWQERRAAMVAYLQARSAADWERVGIHPKRGPLTLFEQLIFVPVHDSIHIEQMTRVLRERRTSATP